MTEQEWLEGADPQAMLRFLHRKAANRKLRLFVCGCCRAFFLHKMPDKARNAVQLAEYYSDGLATKKELVAARKRGSLNTHYAEEARVVQKAKCAAWWATYGRPQVAAETMPHETLSRRRTMKLQGLSCRFDGAPSLNDLRKVTDIV